MFEPNLHGISGKQAAIAHCFSGAVGARLVRYETAEILHDDGQWAPWPDLPIRLFTDSAVMVSLAWSRFDDLWLSNDMCLPFQPDESTTRWVPNAIPAFNEGLGKKICAVHLGKGEMTIEDRAYDFWTRVLIELEGCWLEIFNALDENGYRLHLSMPAGEFIRCC